MSCAPEIFQEGTLKLLDDRLKLSSQCSYNISGDGKLNIFEAPMTEPVHIIDILSCKFSHYDVGLNSIEGYFVKIGLTSSSLVLWFDMTLDFKNFGYACYKLSKSREIAQMLSDMGLSEELAELKMSIDPNSPSKPPRRLSRKTYIHINLDDDNSESYISPAKSPILSEVGCDLSADFCFAFARISTRIAELKKISDFQTPTGFKSNDETKVLRDSSVFSSSALVQQLPVVTHTQLPPTSLAHFNDVTVDVCGDGAIIIKLRPEGGPHTQEQTILHCFKCRKVLCMKCSSPNEEGALEGKILCSDDLFGDLQSIAIGVSVTHETCDHATTSIDNKYTTICCSEHTAQSLCRENIVIIFPTLEVSKCFLSSISKTVPVHNVMGFLMDMRWIINDDTGPYESSAAPHSTGTDSTRLGAFRRGSYRSRVVIEGIDTTTTTATEGAVGGQIRKRSLLATPSRDVIVLPDTVLEDDEEVESEDSNHHSDDIPSHQEVISDRMKVTSASASPIKSQSRADGDGEELTGINPNLIIRRMRSGESTGYSEVDDVEAQMPIHPQMKIVQRGSRVSWLFRRSATKKESFTGPNDVSNRRTATTSEDDVQGSSPVSLGKSNRPVSRFSTLRNIVQSYKDEQAANTSQNTGNDRSSAGSDIGGFGGVKGMPSQQSAVVASTRTTRMFGDGLGSAVGGVAIEGLIVRPIEFTMRQLESLLKDALPPTMQLTHQLSGRSAGREGGSDVTNSRHDMVDPLNLVLDGANISREKHVEMIIWLLKTPIRDGLVMMKTWASVAAGNEFPDHWNAFVQENSSAFVSRVKAHHIELAHKRTLSDTNQSSSPKAHNPSGDDSLSTISSIIISGSGSNASEGGSSGWGEYVMGLSMRYCDVSARGVSILVDSLRWNQHLVSLNLCGNFIGTDAAAASLGNMLNFNRRLVELNVQETQLGNTGVTMVAQALHINTTVEKLILSGNQIGPQGCAMLALALEENSTLTHLNLSRNEIGAQGAKLLANALYINRSLVYLDVNRQKLKGKIGANGTKYIAQGLRMNNSLRVLRLGRNRIGFEGSRHLSGMLLVNRGLRILDLAHSKIGVEGAMQLGGALHQNNSLQSIVLGNRLLPVCYLKGVHDTDYYLRHSRTSLAVDASITDPSKLGILGQEIIEVTPPNGFEDISQKASSSPFNSPSIVECTLEDDVYNATSEVTLNCDIIYECSEKKFDRIDMQVLVVSTVNSEDSTSGQFSESTLGPSSALNELNKPSDDDSAEPSSVNGTRFSGGARSRNEIILPLPLSDEESVLIAHLVRTNNLLHELRLENTFLPIQQLRGRSIDLGGTSAMPTYYSLDLSFSNIVSSDAIVIGMLISENPNLRTICLRGNFFDKTEGESWIADALSKNSTLCLDTNLWSAEEMFSDGYHQLAAVKGISASGAAIEPQRLDTLSYKLLVALGGFAYYLDLMSDIYVTYLYSSRPDLYRESWVIWSAIFISLPTVMTIISIIRTTWIRDTVRALEQMLVVLLQLHPILHVYESVLMGIETTALLDTKFLEGVYEDIPQICLQTYIMFTVSVEHGGFALSIFISVVISLVSVAGVLVMLVDRGKVRKASLGPRERNPWFVRWTARVLALVLENNMVDTGRAHQAMKSLVNYSCFTYSHFLWAMILQFATLSVRVIALTWLLAVVRSAYFVVLIVIFVPRALILAYLDPKSPRRSLFRNFLWCCCYCLISAIWDKDDRFPVSSRRAYLSLNVLDTIECFAFIAYAGFISQNSDMKYEHGVFTVISVVVFKFLSWALILWWQLPVHFSELFSIDKSKISCASKFKSYFLDSDSKVHLTGILTAPMPDPTASPFPGVENSRSVHSGMKTWWSSGERSATLEMSYVSALISKQTPFFKSGTLTATAVPLPSPREEDPTVLLGGAQRDRSRARDWESMPEVIRQSRGRFTLRGGSKNIYNDYDLHKNIEGRSRGIRQGSHHKNKFKGWNKQVVTPALTSRPNAHVTGSSHGSGHDGKDDFEVAEAGDAVQELASSGGAQKSWMGLKKSIRPSGNDAKRRGTANVHYDDFIPQRLSHAGGGQSVSRTADMVGEGGMDMVEESEEEEVKLELARRIHNDILWTENPSMAQSVPGGFRLSDIT